jgi:hypothetical protein
MICPHCSSTEVRHSHSSRWDDFLHCAYGRQAFRCRVCRQRFFASPGAQVRAKPFKHPGRKNHRRKPIDPRKKKRLIRRLIWVGVVVTMFLLFGAFLHYLTLGPTQPATEDTTTTGQ